MRSGTVDVAILFVIVFGESEFLVQNRIQLYEVHSNFNCVDSALTQNHEREA